MVETADVVVVGLGAVGAATLHRLALRGVRAVGIDRYHPPHHFGSTHGETRVTRLAVAEGDEYVPLVRRSHEIWRELEAETGESLLMEVGGLVIGEGDGSPSHGQAGFLGSTIAVARRHGIAHEVLGAADVRRRWPQFNLQAAERAYYEPSAGMAFPERAVAVQLRLAQALGAVVRTGEAVLGIEPCGSGAAVRTAGGRIDAGRVVLAAGAWLPGLAGGALARVATVQRQVLMWFELDEPALYDPARCPVFIWMHGAGSEDYLYGFPTAPGMRGVKVGSERYGAPVDPDTVVRNVPEAEWRGQYERHVAGRLCGVSDRLLRAATCLYTVMPDAGFVLDQLDGGGVIAASACSGHGFKHSPALGERLAAMAVEGGMTGSGEERFAMARFG